MNGRRNRTDEDFDPEGELPPLAEDSPPLPLHHFFDFIDEEPDGNPASAEEGYGPVGDWFALEEEDEERLEERDEELDSIRCIGSGDGSVVDILRHGQRTLAVGEGLFANGPDGLLQKIPLPVSFIATSISAMGDRLFIGTESQGVLCVDAASLTLLPTAATMVDLSAPGDQITRRCVVTAARFGKTESLVVLTADGQLWHIDDQQAVPICPEMHVIAISRTHDKAPLVLASSRRGLHLYRIADPQTALPLSGWYAPADAKGLCGATISVNGDTIAIGHGAPDLGADISVDGGQTFFRSGHHHVTAVATITAEPGSVVIGVGQESGKRSRVLLSVDGGRTWQTLAGMDRWITRLISSDDGRTLSVVTASGVFVLPLPAPPQTH